MKKLILFSLCIILASCVANTKVTSFTDPDYRQSSKFKRVMVFGSGMDLELRQLCETETVNILTEKGISAVRGIDYMPPTRELSSDEAGKILTSSNVDSVLIISLIDTGTNSTYVPPQYHEGNSYSTVNVVGNYAYVNTYKSPGYTTGGYSIKKPRASYKSELHDVKLGRVVWQADGSSRGNAFADFNDLTISASKESVTKLIEDGLL